jgi:hypothetical protein
VLAVSSLDMRFLYVLPGGKEVPQTLVCMKMLVQVTSRYRKASITLPMVDMEVRMHCWSRIVE